MPDPSPNSAGGKGGGASSLGQDPAKLVEDANLLCRAVRNHWHIPDELRRAIPNELLALARAASDDRAAVAAYKALVAIVGQNIQIDQQLDKDARLDAGKNTEQVSHDFKVNFAETRDA